MITVDGPRTPDFVCDESDGFPAPSDGAVNGSLLERFEEHDGENVVKRYLYSEAKQAWVTIN